MRREPHLRRTRLLRRIYDLLQGADGDDIVTLAKTDPL